MKRAFKLIAACIITIVWVGFAAAQTNYRPGQMVEELYSGRWRLATVVEVRTDGVITKMYEGPGVSGSVDLIDFRNIRLPQSLPATSAAKTGPVMQAAIRPSGSTIMQTSHLTGRGCPASSLPAGLSARDRSFASVIIANFTGNGGRTPVSVQIQNLRAGSARSATSRDQYESTVPAGTMMYPMLVQFTICRDYDDASLYHSAQETFICNRASVPGGIACGESQQTNPASLRDWRVQKR